MSDLQFNFESVYDERSLTMEFIESHLSHQMMYERYLNIPSADTRHKFKSPFTQDRTPSGSFFVRDGRLLWKDFSSGRGGDIYTLISELNGGNLSFKEVLKTIASDFGLIKLIGTSTPSLIKKVSPKLLDTAPVDIKVYPKEWSPHEIDYWQNFNINLDILNLYNVKSVREVWISDKIFYKFNVNDPCFRYTSNGGFKIYRPLADKKFKWRTNTGATTIWGIPQLSYKNDIVFITSSLKDVLCLHSIGAESICLNSEGAKIPDKLVNYLQSKYEHVAILFDSDESGLSYAKSEHKRLDIKYLYVPIEYSAKDPSDVVVKYSVRVLKEIIESLLEEYIYESK